VLSYRYDPCPQSPFWTLTPSSQDISLTRKFKEAGRFLDIEILDHIILTSEGYYSFEDNCIS
jgi:DNA repair protein RadC